MKKILIFILILSIASIVLALTLQDNRNVIRKRNIDRMLKKIGTMQGIHDNKGKDTQTIRLNRYYLAGTDSEYLTIFGWSGGDTAAAWRYNKEDKAHGISIEYHPNGQIEAEWPFQNGKLEGKANMYHENGRLAGEWTYNDGRLTGIGKIYDSKGTILLEEKYEDGNLIDRKTYYGSD